MESVMGLNPNVECPQKTISHTTQKDNSSPQIYLHPLAASFPPGKNFFGVAQQF
jgi:hypothetical protein